MMPSNLREELVAVQDAAFTWKFKLHWSIMPQKPPSWSVQWF